MEAVNLPVQIAIQALSSSEAVDAEAAALQVNSSEKGAGLFAALLAEQLGLSADTPVATIAEDAEGARRAADLRAGDEMLHSPPDLLALSGLNPAVTPPETKVHDGGYEGGSSNLTAASAMARTHAAAWEIAEEAQLGRQAIAAQPAAFAVAGDETVFAVSSEAVAEQTARAQQAAPVAAHHAAAPAPGSGAIPQHVSSPEWGDALSDRVVWMVGQQQQGADLRLNPPALGPLEIRLNLSDGQASLAFSTQHVPVREAIEAATPRLREMLGESGISLGSVSVNVGSFSQQPGGGNPTLTGHNQPAWIPQSEGDFSSLTTTVQPLKASGMVDVFA